MAADMLAEFKRFYAEDPDFYFLKILPKGSVISEFDPKTGYARFEGVQRSSGAPETTEYALNDNGILIKRGTVRSLREPERIYSAYIKLVQGEDIVNQKTRYSPDNDFEFPVSFNIAIDRKDYKQQVAGRFAILFRDNGMPGGAFVGFGDAPADLDFQYKARHGLGLEFRDGINYSLVYDRRYEKVPPIGVVENGDVYKNTSPQVIVQLVATDRIVELVRRKECNTDIFTAPRFIPVAELHEIAYGGWRDFVQAGQRFPVSVREPRVG